MQPNHTESWIKRKLGIENATVKEIESRLKIYLPQKKIPGQDCFMSEI